MGHSSNKSASTVSRLARLFKCFPQDFSRSATLSFGLKSSGNVSMPSNTVAPAAASICDGASHQRTRPFSTTAMICTTLLSFPSTL